jgi:enolase-phosphatase E1
VTIALHDRGAQAVLLDIEGTTTPIAFVQEVLFPFARKHLRAYLNDQRESPALQQLIAQFHAEHAIDTAAGADAPRWRSATCEDWLDSTDAYARWLMDRDRKSPALKQLQGWIWERGYRDGKLHGDVFVDTAPAIRRWRAAGLNVAIYSSGSILAQKLLFGTTPAGDLTSSIEAFFDTGVGPKTAPESYGRIAQELKRPEGTIVFVSDVSAELAAARSAGLQVVLSIREGNPTQLDADQYDSIHSLDELVP